MLPDLPLIAYAAQQQVPLFISTGMCSLGEAADAYYCAIEEGSPRVVVLHGTSSYPAALEEVNLQAIATLAGELFAEVGYNDHSAGLDNCIGAAALGAVVVEKQIAFEARRRRLDLHPRAIRGTGAAAQVDGHRPWQRRQAADAGASNTMRRSRAAACSTAATSRGAEKLTWGDLTFLRPVIGLSPAEAYRFVGRILGVDMGAGEFASEQDIAVVEIREKDG